MKSLSITDEILNDNNIGARLSTGQVLFQLKLRPDKKLTVKRYCPHAILSKHPTCIAAQACPLDSGLAGPCETTLDLNTSVCGQEKIIVTVARTC